MKHGAAATQSIWIIWIQLMMNVNRLYNLLFFIPDSILELMGVLLEDHAATAEAGAASSWP